MSDTIELAKSAIGDVVSVMSENGIIRFAAATAVGAFVIGLFDVAHNAMDKGYDIECETEFIKLSVRKSKI